MFVRRSAALACALGLTTALLAGAPAHAKPKPKPPKKPTSAVAPVRLVANGNHRIAIAGQHNFLDTVKLSSAGNGLVVINRLPLERYVLGLNEVPPDWPMHALRAQAVAARTYALWTLLMPPIGDAAAYGFDICASIECQVFTGADVLSLEDGHRWVQAVADTAGEAILYNGRPILARYHSASGGKTFDNEDVFYDEGAYPYLQSVPSPNEEASPLWRWQVRFTRQDLQALLERAGWWGPAHGRLVSARTLPAPSRNGLPYPDILFKGTKKALVRFGDDFRTVARDLAPGMFPGRYPSAGNTSSGRLPETLPSERFTVVTSGNAVNFFGRGWGHGTGMSQWGAHGMARLGFTYVDILRHYYRNTTLGPVGEIESVDVGMAWGLPSVTASGSFKIIDGTGKTLVENALGPWGFTWTGGPKVAINPGAIGPPTDNFGPKKRVPTGGAPIKVEILEAPRTISAGEAVPLTISLSQSARVTTITSGGARFSDLNVDLEGKGRGRITWVAPLEPGRYQVRVEATGQNAAGRSSPIEIVVRKDPPPEDDAGTVSKQLQKVEQTGASAPLVLSALGLLLAVGCVVAAVTMGWWPRQRSSKSR